MGSKQFSGALRSQHMLAHDELHLQYPQFLTIRWSSLGERASVTYGPFLPFSDTSPHGRYSFVSNSPWLSDIYILKSTSQSTSDVIINVLDDVPPTMVVLLKLGSTQSGISPQGFVSHIVEKQWFLMIPKTFQTITSRFANDQPSCSRR